MKIFVDTNIFLDVILKRDACKEGLAVLNGCSAGRFQGTVSDITLLNIDYISRKQVKDVRRFLTAINDCFSVVGADNDLFSSALEVAHPDLEDVVQYYSAKKNGCEVIVTNDLKFYQQDIRVINSHDFVDTFCR